MNAMATPWGPALSQREIAPGIDQLTAAGHGGFKLDDLRNAAVDQRWRRPGGWYEEDCDWAAVVVTFPEHFDPNLVRIASRAIASIVDFRNAENKALWAVRRAGEA